MYFFCEKGRAVNKVNVHVIVNLRFTSPINCCLGVNLYCSAWKTFFFNYNLISFVRVFFFSVTSFVFLICSEINKMGLESFCADVLAPAFWRRDVVGRKILALILWHWSVLSHLRFDADTIWRKDSLALRRLGAI